MVREAVCGGLRECVVDAAKGIVLVRAGTGLARRLLVRTIHRDACSRHSRQTGNAPRSLRDVVDRTDGRDFGPQLVATTEGVEVVHRTRERTGSRRADTRVNTTSVNMANVMPVRNRLRRGVVIDVFSTGARDLNRPNTRNVTARRRPRCTRSSMPYRSRPAIRWQPTPRSPSTGPVRWPCRRRTGGAARPPTPAHRWCTPPAR